MEHSAGLRKIARLNCAGGGQVVVDGQFAYIGHMDPGVGTSIADVSDPLAPRIVAQVPVAPKTLYRDGDRCVGYSRLTGGDEAGTLGRLKYPRPSRKGAEPCHE